MFDLKTFAIKFALLIVFAPLGGLVLVKYVDMVQEAWKTNNRKKKWVAMSFTFAFVMGLLGWLH